MKDYITIEWHVDDVLAMRPSLSDEQARKVLHEAKRRHDAEVGINWDVLMTHAYIMFPSGGEEE